MHHGLNVAQLYRLSLEYRYITLQLLHRRKHGSNRIGKNNLDIRNYLTLLPSNSYGLEIQLKRIYSLRCWVIGIATILDVDKCASIKFIYDSVCFSPLGILLLNANLIECHSPSRVDVGTLIELILLIGVKFVFGPQNILIRHIYSYKEEMITSHSISICPRIRDIQASRLKFGISLLKGDSPVRLHAVISLTRIIMDTVEDISKDDKLPIG